MTKPDCLSWDYWLKIMAVDTEAAEWLGDPVNWSPEHSWNGKAADLAGLFIWHDTPQGHHYWWQVCRQVNHIQENQ